MAPTSRAKAAPPVIANAAQAAATTTLWLTGASSLPSLVRRDLGRRVDPDGSTGRAAATGASPLEGDTVVWVDEVMWVSEVAGAPGPEVDFAVATAQAAESLAFSIAVTEADAAVVGIPRTVLAAYRRAEVLLAESAPGCHLPWWLVAGIGRVESGHAWGGRVDAVGTTRGRILGIRLDGSVSGTAVIRDSDGGSLDGDTLFDRAVGPMQFLPASWRGIARDGNGDKVLNPHNIFDAAATAGAYLCRAGGDLRVPADLARAVLAYNRSGTYLTAVLSWGSRYRSGAWELPDSTGGIPTAPTTAQTTPAPAPSAPVPTTPVPSAPVPTTPVPTTPVPTTPAPTTPVPTTPTTSTSTFTPTGSATATATDPPTATAPLTSGERG
ncbi:MAG: hypothetical protein WAR57_00640 [Candidatus Phosphoribacter sp.]